MIPIQYASFIGYVAPQV